MNEVIEAIKSRRSVRAYKPDRLKREELEAIVEAGTWAPTGHNMQAWHFTVIQDRAKLSEINAKAKEKMAAVNVDWIQNLSRNPNADITHHAPALIIVSYRKEAITGEIDCAAAMENMMIAAESLGVGSCWMGLVAFLFEDADIMRGLGVPEGYKSVQAAVFGYKAENANSPVLPRRKNVATFIGEFD